MAARLPPEPPPHISVFRSATKLRRDPGLWKDRATWGRPDDLDLLIHEQKDLLAEVASLRQENRLITSALSFVEQRHNNAEAFEIEIRRRRLTERAAAADQQRVLTGSGRVSELEAELERLERKLEHLKAFFSAETLETMKREVAFERQEIATLRQRLEVLREIEREWRPVAAPAEFVQQKKAVQEMREMLGRLRNEEDELTRELDESRKASDKATRATERVSKLRQEFAMVQRLKRDRQREVEHLKGRYKTLTDLIRNIQQPAAERRPSGVRRPRPRFSRRTWLNRIPPPRRARRTRDGDTEWDVFEITQIERPDDPPGEYSEATDHASDDTAQSIHIDGQTDRLPEEADRPQFSE
jgi:myosin heavy subunit